MGLLDKRNRLNTLVIMSQEKIIMPKTLTAENGAKGLMTGEFFEYIEVPNESYCGCGECDYCVDVAPEDEQPTILKRIPVSWDTIKEIYNMAVEHLSEKPSL